MKKLMMNTAALALGAAGAHAGGVDRSGQSIGVIFEQGTYVELGFTSVSPEVSGVATAFSPTPGGASGDMTESYNTFSGAFTHNFSDSLSASLIVDQPFGADVLYPAGQPYFATGSVAELNSTAITGIVKYTLPSNVSAYAGLRYQTFEASANIPFIALYDAVGEQDNGLGYLVGIAYENPEYLLRVSLTYNSSIDHSLATTETFTDPVGGAITSTSTTEIETPQSINLAFRSGISEKYRLAVFGGVRWVNWSDFDITPATYEAITGGGSLVSYDDDTFTYTLGLGHAINENWSVFGALGYEKQTGGFASNLGPTDGRFSIGAGARYTDGNVVIEGGASYAWIGDAETTLGGGVAASEFEDNTAFGVGLKIGYRF